MNSASPALRDPRDGLPAAAAMFLALLLAACGPTETAPVRAPTRVGAAAVTTGPAQPPVLTSGVITTREELRLSFKVAGIIRRIGVNEGAAVTAGQQLAVVTWEEGQVPGGGGRCSVVKRSSVALTNGLWLA